ncbi:hypothetical protein CALCODRAFT_111234 [Calocera cornea HHB12733]|uniref:Uncharacterized protein n=1 Tax=Calocera cornea HHB12733 TaxID=1353952 RepID=A0A165D1T4_9BASI|nr:hypothetical protein CALCODRAFT_111234 [Calocera cornea HHB12733]
MDCMALLLIACLGVCRVLGLVVNNVTCTENISLNNAVNQPPCYVFAQIMGQCYNDGQWRSPCSAAS